MEAGSAPSYEGFRFPAEVIAHAVWLYHRFPLSYREVEELLLARGITVSYETIRQWCAYFGPQYAAGLRRRRPRAGDEWHLDEVFIKIDGGAVLPVACRRSGRQRPGHPRAVEAGCEGREAVPGQAHEEAAPRPAGAGARQAPLPQGPDQPGRELPPANETARTRDEVLPFTPRRPEVPRRLQPDLAPLPTPPTSDGRVRVPRRDDHPLHRPEPGRWHRRPARGSPTIRSPPGPTTPSTSPPRTS